MNLHFRFFFTVSLCLGAAALTIEQAPAQTSFTDVTNSTGLGAYRAYAGDIHSPGGVFTDLNNDGYADLYLVSSDGATGYNRLYLNVDDGNGGREFSLQTNAAGAVNNTGTLGDDPYTQNGENRFRGATGAIAGDYDNDGDLDLYITNMGGPNRLYRNQLIETGVLVFTDVTLAAGNVTGINDLIQAGESSPLTNNSDDSLTAIWFDPDKDGDLDLYVGNHNDFSQPFPYEGAPDTFYINNGDGTFTESTAMYNLGGHENSSGNPVTYADSNAVVSSDIDNDGWPDLIVTNKSGGNASGTNNIAQIYINDGVDSSGTWLGYTTVSYSNMLADSFRDNLITRSAMGASLADIDNDGDFDIYISDNPTSGISGINGSSDLFVNLQVETGELRFEHALVNTGLSWGVQMQDFDNDGDIEIHTTNDTGAHGGYAALLEFVDLQNLTRIRTNADASNPLFQGMPNGDTIANVVDVAMVAGAGNFNRNGRGNMAADYNQDGRIDMFLVNLNNDSREPEKDDPSALLLNTTNNSNSFLNVKLIGAPDSLSDDGFATSRDAVGSRVIVTVDVDGDGTPEQLTKEVRSGFGNATSTSSYDLMFGLGVASDASVSVQWADGRVNDIGMVSANQFLVIDQANLDDKAPEPFVYFEGFDGPSGDLLDGTMEESGQIWLANGFATTDGNLDGTQEGSAVVPLNPEADNVYTLTMDVTNATDRWIALGFCSQSPDNRGGDSAQDRFAQNAAGIAWMLYRQHATNVVQDVEIFAGPATAGVVADNNFDFFASGSVTRELKIVLDTRTTGGNFTADFMIDGSSVLNGPPINSSAFGVTIDDINFVGFSFDDSTTQSVVVDNFSLRDLSSDILGDVNCDGVVNLLDVVPFIDLLSSGGFSGKADINQDGVLNLLDVEPFVGLLSGG